MADNLLSTEQALLLENLTCVIVISSPESDE